MDQTLIIGLGNPDPALENTYHNVGTLAVEWLAARAAEADGAADGSAVKFRAHKDIFSYASATASSSVRSSL